VVALAAAVVVLVGVGAGSCGPATPPARNDATTSATESSTSRPGPVGDRHTDFDLADGMRPHTIEFYDGYTAYLMFLGCDNRCQGALFVTFDGGLSWLERKLPVTTVDNLQLYLVDERTVVLFAEPGGWYRSTDTGRTFTLGGPGHPDPANLVRGVTVGCPTAGDCPGQVLLDGVALPAQPPLPGRLHNAVRAKDGPIWAISVDGTVVHTAMSADGGRTWQRFGRPVTSSSVEASQLQVSPDGGDVWLIVGAGAGAVAAYKVEGADWREVDARLDLGPGRLASAAAGSGILAVAGGGEFGYLYSDGRWIPSRRPFSAQWVRALPDGTLITLTTPGDVWLGSGNGAARTWNHVTVAVV
jgi:hypothetical protein